LGGAALFLCPAKQGRHARGDHDLAGGQREADRVAPEPPWEAAGDESQHVHPAPAREAARRDEKQLKAALSVLKTTSGVARAEILDDALASNKAIVR